ncbi:hypothetical protein JCM6882_003415 [Rhodosporidiobolus microsporus]
MGPYQHLAVNASDAELGLSAKAEPRSTAPSTSTTAARAGRSLGGRLTDQQKKLAGVGGAALLLIVLVLRWTGGGSAGPARIDFGPPQRTVRERGGTVPDAKTLLTPAAPATSYWDALRPDLRYLTADSWSGLTGQYLSALSLLYLGHLTQRVTILPSWRDWDHYGDSMITMGLLFDMERFRQDTGALFVDWDEVKPLDRQHKKTQKDEIGCYMGNNAFEGGRSFDEHHLDESIWRVGRTGGWFEHAIESFVLWDYDEGERLKRTKTFAEENERKMPKNLQGSQLLCYSNVWDLKHAGAHATGIGWDHGFLGQQKQDGDSKEMLPLAGRASHPEWWALGQYMDFKPEIWNIAISVVKRTLKLNYVPRHLITIHLRRGDFKTWCSSGSNCTPALDAYNEKLAPLLAISPPGTRVLVTTDEQNDRDFLRRIDARGWYRVDHRKLGTFGLLESRYGDAARWADAVVDQAILSLGSHFVGTAGSQVSLVTELRVAAWNGGETRLVQRPS